MKTINKFTAFTKLIATHINNIVFINNKLHHVKKYITTYPYHLKKTEILVSINNDIYIVYNTKTTYLECIFASELEYIQTSFYLKNPGITSGYAKYFLQRMHNVKNALILGLCLGNIPNAIYTKHSINRIDCVDINSILCKLYKKFFKLSTKIHVYVDSAVTFIENSNKLYDTILVDIPIEFITQSFMNNIYNIITSNGYVYINLIGSMYNKLNIKKLFNMFNIKYYKVIDENYLYIITKINNNI